MHAAMLVALALAQTPPVPAPATKPAATTCAPAPPPSSPWSATVGLGLIWLTGNTRSITMTGNVVATRTSASWIFGLKASGTYGQGQGEDDSSQVLALNGSLQLRGDRRFGPRVSAYVLGGAETDHVKSVEYRALGEGGASYYWLDDKSAGGFERFFRTDLGVRYSRESRFQYYPVPLDIPDVFLVAPRLAFELRLGRAEGVSFLQTAEVLTNVAGESRTVFNSLSKLSVHLVAGLALGVSLTVAYDSAPAEDRVPTDTATSLQLDYTL